MAVPELKRTVGKLKVIMAARENVKHTMQVCKSEKNFPKRDRWILTNRIVDAASDIFKFCIMANNINVQNYEDYALRRRYQMMAKGSAFAQLSMIQIAFETLPLSISMEAWIEKIDTFLTLLERWMDSDRKINAKIIEAQKMIGSSDKD